MTVLKSIVEAPLQGVLLFVALLSAVPDCSVADTRRVNVKYVLDGDTVVLSGGEKVRLLGINAPEKEYKNRAAQPYALEALLAMREMVEGKAAILIEGKQQTDSYGRRLGYLELPNGTDTHEILLARGYAFVVAFPPDIDRLDHYLQIESIARHDRLGVWQDNYYAPVDASSETHIKPGFGLFKGKIDRVRKSRKNVLIELGSALVVVIRHHDWNRYWQGSPGTLKNKMIETRGWINPGKGKNYLRVRHPMMMRIIE